MHWWFLSDGWWALNGWWYSPVYVYTTSCQCPAP